MCDCQSTMVRSDSPSVGRRDEDCLRRFVACRDRGDSDGARAAWAELVEVSHDRVRGLVDVWSYTHTPLSPAEREEATQRAMIKMFERVAGSFTGSEMGQLHLTLTRLVDFRCKDVIADAVRRRERETGLETTWVDDEGKERGHHPGELAASAWRWTRDAEVDAASSLIEGALARMPDGPKKAVVERTLDGVPVEDIMAELRTSRENVYQLRRRGLLVVRGIIDEMEQDA